MHNTIIERCTQLLTELRENKIEINYFLYREGKDDEKISFDLNATKRFQLLKAMQYNPVQTDEPLLVELFKAEIERHKKNPFQGIFPALQLCAYLLSSYQKPEYVELFLKAKQANFDTYCGFDYKYLVSAGIVKTFEYIETKKPSYLEAFYHHVGNSISECDISEQDFKEWKELLEDYYPSKLVIKNVEDEIDLAIELNETEILKEKIDEWEQSIQSWTQLNLKQLSNYKETIDDTKGQIWADEQLLEFLTTDWDKASGLQLFSELLLKINDIEKAWLRLKEIQIYVEQIPDWKIYGLGRAIIETYFDLVLSINNSHSQIAKEAFKWASKEVNDMEIHLNLVEKVMKAANLMGDTKISHKFKKIYESESQKLNDSLK